MMDNMFERQSEGFEYIFNNNIIIHPSSSYSTHFVRYIIPVTCVDTEYLLPMWIYRIQGARRFQPTPSSSQSTYFI